MDITQHCTLNLKTLNTLKTVFVYLENLENLSWGPWKLWKPWKPKLSTCTLKTVQGFQGIQGCQGFQWQAGGTIQFVCQWQTMKRAGSGTGQVSSPQLALLRASYYLRKVDIRKTPEHREKSVTLDGKTIYTSPSILHGYATAHARFLAHDLCHYEPASWARDLEADESWDTCHLARQPGHADTWH